MTRRGTPEADLQRAVVQALRPRLELPVPLGPRPAGFPDQDVAGQELADPRVRGLRRGHVAVGEEVPRRGPRRVGTGIGRVPRDAADLTPADTKAMSDAISGLAEPISKVAAAISADAPAPTPSA